MKITERYNINKSAKVGISCICPSCNTEFVKSNYQQAFCKSKKGTVCKDKYWNTVDPSKRNNTTRISPANARFSAKQYEIRQSRQYKEYDPQDDEHPFSSEGLGQWDD